ncbi:MAG: DUF4139 domain-containing protein [Bacteroidetes bacterium]|nr:MAG: DUF4139 domain-containing protein [Bacteroidota bacterium]TAG89539.1 MAG: DUF4139 domain-containing protein [Bacteroidota bacterium]
MKIRIVFVAFFVLITSLFVWKNLSAEGDKDISKIITLPLKSAEIYLKNTLMTHEINVKLNVGDTLLHFGEIAENIDTNQIFFDNVENIQILKKEFRNFLSTNPAQEKEYKIYQDSIQTNKDSLQQYKIELESITKTQEMVFNQKSSNQEITADKLKEMSKFLKQYYNETQKESKNWQKKIKIAEEKNITFEKKIAKINQTPNQKLSQLLLFVKVNKKTETNLIIKYITNAASWKPTQVFSLGEKDSLVKLTQNAIISQNTGIHWKKIKISLANKYQPKNEKIQNFPPIAENISLHFDTLNTKDSTQNKIKIKEKIIEKNTENITKKEFKEEFDVNSGEELKLLWSEKNYAFEKKIMGWFAENPQIYHVAILKNWQQNDFENSTAQMNYLDKKPILIHLNSNEKKIILPLENVAEINLKSTKKIISSSEINKIWQIDFEAKSFRNDTLEVVFEEILPISVHKNLSIEPKNINNNGEQKENKISWKMVLLPQQKKEWNLQIEAKFPKNSILQ